MSSSSLTQKPEWNALLAHAREMQGVRLHDLFLQTPDRFDAFSVGLEGLLFDYAKHRMTKKTLDLLCALADSCSLDARRDEMFHGALVNTSEERAALHMALRGTQPKGLNVGGEDIGDFVSSVLMCVHSLSESIRSNPDITDVIHVGIGGSDLGPRLACCALRPFADGPRIHFLSNIDGQELDHITRTLKPHNTAVIIVSKTFSTLETLANTRALKNWMAQSLNPDDITARLVGVTMNAKAAKDFGIKEDNILPLRDWIGGRFSLWSAAGLAIAIACGSETFKNLLAGAKAADEHFLKAPHNKNIPVLMALTGIWYRNFWNIPAHAILPYAQGLEYLPAYLQQLEMESNGKAAGRSGGMNDYLTSPVIFGQTGTNAQHAFMQMLHQSSTVMPSDFILIAQPSHDHHAHHRHLLANGLAQAQALMQGQSHPDQPHRHFEGNRPSSTFVLKHLDAYHLGLLLAFYEHKVFVQGIIWDINSFDQWGVELGKTLAGPLAEKLEKPSLNINLDSSTAGLLRTLKTFTQS